MTTEHLIGLGDDKPRDTNPTHCAVGLVAQPVRSVADIPDDELLRRVVRTLVTPRPRRAEFPWVEVHRAFGLGSTYAAQLCRRFGFDPDTGEPLKTPNGLAQAPVEGAARNGSHAATSWAALSTDKGTK